jgi:TonB family protein
MTSPSTSGGALTLSWCLMVALMLGARLSSAHAAHDAPLEEAVMRFDLPAQPLALSLAVFGRVTGHSVLVAGGLTAGREAAPVQGDFAPRDALGRMLAGTDLVARYISPNAFTLVPLQQDEAARGATGTRAPGDAGRAEDEQAQAANGAYAAVLQRAITRVLCAAQPDAFGRYRLGVQLWIGPEGLVSAARLLEGSGVRERDAAVVERLRTLDLQAPPPAALAQPVTILLTPRANPQRDCRAMRLGAGAAAGMAAG